jgi:hypothetical protein
VLITNLTTLLPLALIKLLPETSAIERADSEPDSEPDSEHLSPKAQAALRDQDLTLALASPEVADDVAVRLDITL